VLPIVRFSVIFLLPNDSRVGGGGNGWLGDLQFNYPYHLKFGNQIIGALCINTQSISDAKRIIQHKELMINYGE